MERLFVLADAVHPEHPERSDRYVQIARRISTRTRVRMPRRLKHLFCSHCGSYLPPGKMRVRLLQGVLTSTCPSCGWQMRQPYRPLKAGQEGAGYKNRDLRGKSLG
jgi:ribonuclease P protein subunit RPR2